MTIQMPTNNLEQIKEIVLLSAMLVKVFANLNSTTVYSNAADPITLTLNGVTIPDGETVCLDDVGQGSSALHCHTPYTDCCKSQVLGEFYYPNGIAVPRRSVGDELYRNRGDSFIRLNNRQTGAALMTGIYQCCLPNGCGKNECVSVDLGKIC